MGVKTDYLKDCITNNTITVQDIINMKKNMDSIPSPDSVLDDVDNKLNNLENDLNKKIDKNKEDCNNADKKLQDEINDLKNQLNDSLNVVETFKYKEIIEIQRNANNDIIKIIFKDGSLVLVEYINLPYENEYINYMPSRISYYNKSGKILAVDEIGYRNESIIKTLNKTF